MTEIPARPDCSFLVLPLKMAVVDTISGTNLRAREEGHPLRVAVFLYRFPVASETFVNSQIEGLVRRGVTVDVIAQAREPRALEVGGELGVRAVRFAPSLDGSRGRRLLRALKVAGRVVSRRPDVLLRSLDVVRLGRSALSQRLRCSAVPFLDEDYDVVHCHFGPAGLHAVMLREIGALRGRISTVFHGWDVSSAVDQRGRGYYRLLFERGDLFLPVSERWRDRLLALGADSSRVAVHHMGVRIPPGPTHVREGGRAITFASVCRLVEKKGIAFALEALARLQTSTLPWNYRIIGEGPERPRLEALAGQLGIADRVSFEGWQAPDSIARTLSEADVFVAPSVTATNGDQEGIPVGIMEAMAHALPVVSSEHSGIPEIVEHEVSGLLAPERDTDRLGAHLKRLLEDVEARRRLGQAGRARVEAEYDIEKLNDALVRQLRELAFRREAPAA